MGHVTSKPRVPEQLSTMAGESSSSFQAPAHGALCRLHTSLPDGERVLQQFKCWSPLGAIGLRWELRRVLPAVGMKDARWSRLNSQIRSVWGEWQAVRDLAGLEGHAHMRESRRALMARSSSDQVFSDCGQEWWVSTPMLIALLCHLKVRRRRLSDRDLATSLLSSFMDMCLPVAAAAAMKVLDFVAEALENCGEEVFDGQC